MSPRFSYDDLDELIEAFASLELDTFSLTVRRDRIVELIEPFASCREICGATPWSKPDGWKSEATLEAEERCVLLVQGSDASGGVDFMMIPRSRCTSVLDEALRTIDGRTFAGPEDLKPQQWDAAVRCMAAMGEGGSPALSWIENDLTGWDKRRTRCLLSTRFSRSMIGGWVVR